MSVRRFAPEASASSSSRRLSQRNGRYLRSPSHVGYRSRLDMAYPWIGNECELGLRQHDDRAARECEALPCLIDHVDLLRILPRRELGQRHLEAEGAHARTIGQQFL